MAKKQPGPPSLVSPPKSAVRASWIGVVKLGKFAVPCKGFAAVATPPATPLAQICGKCKKKIEVVRGCPKCGSLDADQIAMGYPYGKKFVALSKEELGDLVPAQFGELVISRVIDPAEFSPVPLAGRALNLEPETPLSLSAYVTLWGAITRTKLWPVGRIVLGRHAWHCVVFASKHGLHVATLWDGALIRPVNVSPRETRGETSAAIALAAAVKRLPRGLPKVSADDVEARILALVKSQLKKRGAE